MKLITKTLLATACASVLAAPVMATPLAKYSAYTYLADPAVKSKGAGTTANISGCPRYWTGKIKRKLTMDFVTDAGLNQTFTMKLYKADNTTVDKTLTGSWDYLMSSNFIQFTFDGDMSKGYQDTATWGLMLGQNGVAADLVAGCNLLQDVVKKGKPAFTTALQNISIPTVISGGRLGVRDGSLSFSLRGTAEVCNTNNGGSLVKRGSFSYTISALGTTTPVGAPKP